MDLFDAAFSARLNAHAPYSGFKVGAAIRSADGAIYAGCNVENIAYPQGLCAEAGAISAMVAAGAQKIVEILVLSDSDIPITPCGGCRQKLAEFAEPGTPVVMCGLEGELARSTLGELLPGSFSAEHMTRVER